MSPAARELWDNAQPITGKLAETYLRSRGITPPNPAPACLRFAPELRHPSGKSFPALIAQVTHTKTGAMQAIQRIYLAPDGEGKAPVDGRQQKMSLGPTKGGVVRLAEPMNGAPVLAGEGIETVLTAMEATGLSGLATLGTSGLKDLELPDGVTRAILLTENDGGPNEKALAKVAPAFSARGVELLLAHPAPSVKDFNDYVKGKNGAAREAGLSAVRAAIKAAETPSVLLKKDPPSEREAVIRLGEGDPTAFLRRAKLDPGFPFEPGAIVALIEYRKRRSADFERLRARLRAETKVRVSALADAMKAETSRDGPDDGLPGRPITFEEIEPWLEHVDGAALLADIAETIGKYVIMEPCQRDAAALGAVFAHAHDLRDTAPIFFIV
jgi:hypothetical protein